MYRTLINSVFPFWILINLLQDNVDQLFIAGCHEGDNQQPHTGYANHPVMIFANSGINPHLKLHAPTMGLHLLLPYSNRTCSPHRLLRYMRKNLQYILISLNSISGWVKRKRNRVHGNWDIAIARTVWGKGGRVAFSHLPAEARQLRSGAHYKGRTTSGDFGFRLRAVQALPDERQPPEQGCVPGRAG